MPGFRPIAVGEEIRRLVSKCEAKESASEKSEFFRPKQLGVAVKERAETQCIPLKQPLNK